MSALEALHLNRETNQQIITHINRSTTEGNVPKDRNLKGIFKESGFGVRKLTMVGVGKSQRLAVSGRENGSLSMENGPVVGRKTVWLLRLSTPR